MGSKGVNNEISFLADNAEAFRLLVRRLIDSFKQFSSTGAIRDGFILSDTLMEFGTTTKDDFTHESEVVQIGDTLKRLETERRHMLESIQMIVISPLEEFLRNDMGALQAFKDNLESTKEAYEQSQLKFDVARTSGKTTGKKGKELEEMKRLYSLAQNEYASKLTDILAKREFEVVEKLCSFIFAQANYFHDGYELLSQMEPAMRQMMDTLVTAQNDYLQGKSSTNIDEAIMQRAKMNTHMGSEAAFKQGYVEIKKKTWSRKWMVVSDGFLYIYKSWKDLDPIQCVNLLLCTVKVMPAERDHCFMVISPEVNMTVQGMSAEDVAQWVASIESGIALQLTKKQTSSNAQSELTTSEAKFNYLRELREVSDANTICADCQADSPEWGLMNLGVLICYECSGVHRSLGVHISKVRSLTLDSWNEELFHIIKTCGNERGNQIYEYSLASSGVKKPSPNSNRDARAQYIRMKYEERAFVKPVIGTKTEQEKGMLEACTAGDLFKVMEYIAQQVDVNFKIEDEEGSRSLIHQLAIDGRASTYILELLIQNGAHVYSMDSKGWTPLHYAALYDRVTFARMFVMRGATQNMEDKEGVTPLKLAQEKQDSQVADYFAGKIKDEDLAGMQPADMESLRRIKANFSDNIDVVKTKLSLLRQDLKAAQSMEEVFQIAKMLKIVHLAVCFSGK